MSSSRKSGRFSAAVSAAIEAKDADHAFHAFVPTPTSAPAVNSSVSVQDDKALTRTTASIPAPSLPVESKSFTYHSSVAATIRQPSSMPSLGFKPPPVPSNGTTFTTSHSPLRNRSPKYGPGVSTHSLRSPKRNLRSSSQESSSSEAKSSNGSRSTPTDKVTLRDVVTLQHLTVSEKAIIIIVALVGLTVQFYYHSLYERSVSTLQSMMGTAQTTSQFIVDEYFTGAAAPRTLASIAAGCALSLLFDSKPMEFDALVAKSLYKLFTPVGQVLHRVLDQVVGVVAVFRQIVELWRNTPRVVKYIVGLLLLLSMTRRVVVGVYVNVFVAHGETIVAAAGVALIVIVFALVGLAGYGIVRMRNTLLERKYRAVEGVSEAVIAYLQEVARPEPISHVHRLVLDLEQQHQQSPSSTTTKHGPASLSSPSASLPGASSPGGKESPKVVLPEEVVHVSLRKIWQDVVKKVSMDARVSTTMRLVHGRNEQCWKYTHAATKGF